jgi:hypothetical protein
MECAGNDAALALSGGGWPCVLTFQAIQENEKRFLASFPLWFLRPKFPSTAPVVGSIGS